MTIGERIKERRKELGISVDELAEKLGKNRATIYRYESSDIEKLPTTVLEPLSEALRTTPSYLMGWDDPAPVRAPLSTTPFHPDQMTPIPVIGKVAAGYTCLAEQYIEGYALADPESMTDGYEYFWLRVTGDSMEPDIQEGDLVLVRVQETVESGDCAVVLVDEEDGLVKNIEIGRDHVTLYSKNPSYPPRVFVREDANRVRIVGKVVELKRAI